MRFSKAKLERALDAAPPEAWEAGLEWYADANRWCRRVATENGLTMHRVAGILAALSPNQGWEANQRETLRVITERKAAQFPLNVERALAILDGARPLDVLGGHKVRSFYRNLAYLCPESVTIDRHAASVLSGVPSPEWTRAPYKHLLEAKFRYEAASDIYRQVAESRGFLPHELQAVAWVAHRLP